MNSRQILVAPWLRRFFTEHLCSERSLAINTQKSYRDCFSMLLPFVSAEVRKPIERLVIEDLSATRVIKFLSHLEGERGCSIQTRNQRLAAIRAFARYVSTRELICVEWAAAVRAITTKKTHSRSPQWLSKDQIEALLNVPNQRQSKGRMEYALLLFLYNTGARVSEAIAVQVRDIQLESKTGRRSLATLYGKGGKRRQCPLWSRTEKALAELVRDKRPHDVVFLSQLKNPYSRWGIYRLVERCASQVPSLADRKLTPHVIRHSCACHLLQSGVDLNTIRVWLGHVSLDTTNIYTEIDLEMKVKAMQLSDPYGSENRPSWKHNNGLMTFLASL